MVLFTHVLHSLTHPPTDSLTRVFIALAVSSLFVPPCHHHRSGRDEQSPQNRAVVCRVVAPFRSVSTLDNKCSASPSPCFYKCITKLTMFLEVHHRLTHVLLFSSIVRFLLLLPLLLSHTTLHLYVSHTRAKPLASRGPAAFSKTGGG